MTPCRRLLPAQVSESDAERLLSGLVGDAQRLTVDLETQTIEGVGAPIRFTIDPIWRLKLLNGWDDLDLTASYTDAVEAWSRADARRRPWAYPAV